MYLKEWSLANKRYKSQLTINQEHDQVCEQRLQRKMNE
jgi:hypothetical protein